MSTFKVKMSLQCYYQDCTTIPVFGYDDNRNISCQVHKEDDMVVTFNKDDYAKNE